jgi:hypothetical protein
VEITTLPNVRFCFIKCFQKNGVCAGRSTWRVLPWHGGGSEYLEGTADVWRWSCSIDQRSISLMEFPPSLEILLNVSKSLL